MRAGDADQPACEASGRGFRQPARETALETFDARLGGGKHRLSGVGGRNSRCAACPASRGQAWSARDRRGLLPRPSPLSTDQPFQTSMEPREPLHDPSTRVWTPSDELQGRNGAHLTISKPGLMLCSCRSLGITESFLFRSPAPANPATLPALLELRRLRATPNGRTEALMESKGTWAGSGSAGRDGRSLDKTETAPQPPQARPDCLAVSVETLSVDVKPLLQPDGASDLAFTPVCPFLILSLRLRVESSDK